MSDTDESYRALLRLKGPDLWDDIKNRRPGPIPPAPGDLRRRMTAAAAALVIAAGGVGLTINSLRTVSDGDPATSAVNARLTARLQVGPRGQVRSVLAAPGSVWVTAYGVGGEEDSVLRRIDPSTNAIVATISLEGVPGWEIGGGGMAFGSESLWVTGIRPTDAGREAILQRIDPATYEILATIPLSGTSSGDVAIHGADVWVASFWDSEPERSAELARIDPATNEIVARVPLAQSYVRRVVAVDGAVVVEEKALSTEDGPDTVLESIDSETNQILATTAPDAWGPGGSILEQGGHVWATSGDGFVQVDLGTALPTAQSAGRRDAACCVLAGSDRGIWFYDDGTVELFDTQTGEVRSVLELPDFAASAAGVTQDAIWILSWEGELARVDLR